MNIPILCTQAHYLLPALTPGDALTLSAKAGVFYLQMRCSPSMLRRLAEAQRDGALVADDRCMSLEEIAADVEAKRQELDARITRFLAQAQAARQAEAG